MRSGRLLWCICSSYFIILHNLSSLLPTKCSACEFWIPGEKKPVLFPSLVFSLCSLVFSSSFLFKIIFFFHIFEFFLIIKCLSVFINSLVSFSFSQVLLFFPFLTLTSVCSQDFWTHAHEMQTVQTDCNINTCSKMYTCTGTHTLPKAQAEFFPFYTRTHARPRILDTALFWTWNNITRTSLWKTQAKRCFCQYLLTSPPPPPPTHPARARVCTSKSHVGKSSSGQQGEI